MRGGTTMSNRKWVPFCFDGWAYCIDGEEWGCLMREKRTWCVGIKGIPDMFEFKDIQEAAHFVKDKLKPTEANVQRES